MKLDKRIEAACSEAEAAFWSKIADHFPEIETGDFPPFATMQFMEACTHAAKIWVESNRREAQ